MGSVVRTSLEELIIFHGHTYETDYFSVKALDFRIKVKLMLLQSLYIMQHIIQR